MLGTWNTPGVLNDNLILEAVAIAHRLYARFGIEGDFRE